MPTRIGREHDNHRKQVSSAVDQTKEAKRALWLCNTAYPEWEARVRGPHVS